MTDPGWAIRAAAPFESSGPVGREHELAATAALLASSRLVTLTGPAGIGKTRIAMRAVRTPPAGRPGSPAPLLWASLGELPEEEWAALEDVLVERLGRGPALLVLDGCEQLGGTAGGLAAQLLTRRPELRVLATSQWPLGVSGESCLAVPPLTVPPVAYEAPGGGPPDPEDYPAVRLFADRARAVDPRFVLDRRSWPAVARVCRALDGVPGALELAAGRLGGIAAEQVPRRLDNDPLGFLSGGADRRGARADTERTHALCPPEQRLLWERLSVFAGSFDRAAADAVCGFGALGDGAAGEVLADLAPGVLVETAPGRYRLPLAARAHGARLLLVRGETAATTRRHHEWYRLAAERAGQLWRAGHQREARALALRELPDLRSAMNPVSGPGPGGALEVAGALWFLWAACGRAAEGRGHLERALALHPAPRPARALWLAGWLTVCLGRPEAAEPLLVEGWAAAVQEGEDTCLAYLAQARGSLALWRGRDGAAAEEFREGLELLPAEPEFGPGAGPLLAGRTLVLARTDPASVPLEEGPPGLPGDAWSGAWTGFAHAEVLCREGRPERARREVLAALGVLVSLGDLLGQAAAGELLAALEAERGRDREAARLLGAADRLRGGPEGPEFRACRRAPLEARLRSRLPEEVYAGEYAAGARGGLRHVLHGLPGPG
ncbi:hypothetical protein [Streptomyces sp. NPDC097619]|uniref:ATP-binding protein n=1 Tax=Streptomyces sp. NPDC097619 TaxID=3157228 RepID=UPI00332C9297